MTWKALAGGRSRNQALAVLPFSTRARASTASWSGAASETVLGCLFWPAPLSVRIKAETKPGALRMRSLWGEGAAGGKKPT